MAYTPQEYQEMLAGGCPWCGEAIVIRHGKYGDFIACSEWCGFTKSIPGRSFLPPRQIKKKGCLKCQDSGLLPFQNKESKIISYTYLFCECHQSSSDPEHEKERYIKAMPQDTDYPVSYSYWRSLCQYYSWPDPGPDKPAELIRETKPLFRPRSVDKEIEQLKTSAIHLKTMLSEHIVASKKASEKKKKHYEQYKVDINPNSKK